MPWSRSLDKYSTTKFSEPEHIAISMDAETSELTCDHVAGHQERKTDAEPSGLTPIAIVGMACRLPGNVCSAEEFWEMICRGRHGWSQIPEHRFSTSVYSHPNPEKKGTFNARGGYFLEHDLAMFDAPFFNITRAEAEAMGMFLPVLPSDERPNS